MTAKKNDVLKTMDQNVSARGVTLSNDPDLFFHTDAAEQISDQLGHAQGDRERLAKKIFEAIHAGEIDAYSMRDGSLLRQLDKKHPVAMCVRIHNVNEWLEKNGHRQAWRPREAIKPTLPASVDLTMMANRKALINAFGSFTGMNDSWFKNLKDTPKLKAARKVTGQGGRSHIQQPFFCPYEVMMWLINPKRRKGRKLGPDKGWAIFESHFPRAYFPRSPGDPRT